MGYQNPLIIRDGSQTTLDPRRLGFGGPGSSWEMLGPPSPSRPEGLGFRI